MNSVRVAECILFHNYLGNGNYFYKIYLHVFNSKRYINLLASFLIFLPPPTFFFVRNPFRMLDRKLQFSKVLFFSQEYSAVFQTDLGIFLCNSANFQNSSQNILYKKPSSFVNLKFFAPPRIFTSAYGKSSVCKMPLQCSKNGNFLHCCSCTV